MSQGEVTISGTAAELDRITSKFGIRGASFISEKTVVFTDP